MTGDAGVEPTAFGSGDVAKTLAQIAVNLWKLHQFPWHLKFVIKKSASWVLSFFHGLSRNLTKFRD
jgi:hypothetical protein